MSCDSVNGGGMLSSMSRRKQTNPKQLHPSSVAAGSAVIKQEMTVAEDCELGSFFHLTPRHSLEVPPPLQPTTKRSNSDGNIVGLKELALSQQKRNSFPFAVFPSLFAAAASSSLAQEGHCATDLTGGPPPLAKIAPIDRATCLNTPVEQLSTSSDQPINLSAVDNLTKRRSSTQVQAAPMSVGEADGSDVLDLSAKPSFLSHPSGGSPSVTGRSASLIPVAEVAPFIPPQAHSSQKSESSKWCRHCSREIELTSIEALGGDRNSGLCITCQLVSRSPIAQVAPQTQALPFNPLASVSSPLSGFTGVPPIHPGLPFDFAMARTLLSSVFAQNHSLQFGVPPATTAAQDDLSVAARRLAPDVCEVERRKCDSTEACGSPASNTDSSDETFLCSKCNINFRSAKSLEAHLVDYCQQPGTSNKPKGGKRRSVDVTNTGQDLVCQLCGYHGHSERGIRVHFNAMHSIGSEIQLEQYLKTMIVRADPSSASLMAPTSTSTTVVGATSATTGHDAIPPLEKINPTPGLLAGLTSTSPAGGKKRRLNDDNLPGAKSNKQQNSQTAGRNGGEGHKQKRGSLSRNYSNRSGGGGSVGHAPVTPSNSGSHQVNNKIGGSTGAAGLAAGGSLRRQPPFECRLCSKTFPDTAKLRLHMRSHEKDESIMYSCKRCNNFTTPVKSDLVRHVKVEHEGVNMRVSTWTVSRQTAHGERDGHGHGHGHSHRSATSGDVGNGGNSNSSDDGPTFCDICQISFRFKHSYEAHRQYYCMAKWTESSSANRDGDEDEEDDSGDDDERQSRIDVDDDEARSAPPSIGVKSENSNQQSDNSSIHSSVAANVTNKQAATSSDHQPTNSITDDEIDENSSVDVTS